jgi:16S rRNA (uracil1498-N3)-methyltransferase
MPRIWVSSNELGRDLVEDPTLRRAAGDLGTPATSAVTIAGEGHRYLARVLRVGVGARVDLFDGRGNEATTTVLRVGPRDLTLQIVSRRQVVLPSTPPVTLLQGLPRPERMDLIVQKAAELGAARLVPVRTARSASGQSPRAERWERIAREAARQSGRAELLEIAPLASVATAVAGMARDAVGFVPWEDAPDAPALGKLVPERPAGVTILIGPEGGLTAEEVATATGAGFQIATLGPRILRTETAAIAALAVIQNRVGGLG